MNICGNDYCPCRVEEAPSSGAVAVPEEDAEEVEPSWELPEELQEFKGDADDRKGMLAFRQKQQSGRQVGLPYQMTESMICMSLSCIAILPD